MKKKLAMALMTATMSLTMMAGSVGAGHPEPTMKSDCMGGNFAEYNTNLTDGIQRFKNQGQCIKFVVTGK
jgi:hypothetical protein